MRPVHASIVWAAAVLCAHAPAGFTAGAFVDPETHGHERTAPTASPLDAASHAGPLREAILDPNELGLHVWNDGTWGWTLGTFEGGLRYPRGSSSSLVFAAGPWIAGRVPDLRMAITEFASDFVPGPIAGGTWSVDSVRHVVYAVSRHDTTGRAAWMQRAVPMGAPTDASGTAPGLVGERTLWTVFNDANPAGRHGSRGSLPIGLEVQLTAFAFDRPGLERAAFLRYAIVHKGTDVLDSAYVGLWVDWLPGPRTVLAASDSARQMAYAYRSTAADPGYGARGPAIGVRLLRGPRDPGSGQPLRATSNVVWPNGTDPQTTRWAFHFLTGHDWNGSSLVDSSTMQPTRWWSPGDPVTGTGWNAVVPEHPHGVLSVGPFRMAPGDTQRVDAVIVVGQGTDRLGSVLQLRTSADSLAQLFADDFAWAPPPPPPPPPPTPLPPWPSVRAWPNPGAGPVAIAFTAPPSGAVAEVSVHDLLGRRVRTLARGLAVANRGEVTWDGRDEDGRQVRPGLYLIRARVGGAVATTRCLRVE